MAVNTYQALSLASARRGGRPGYRTQRSNGAVVPAKGRHGGCDTSLYAPISPWNGQRRIGRRKHSRRVSQSSQIETALGISPSGQYERCERCSPGALARTRPVVATAQCTADVRRHQRREGRGAKSGSPRAPVRGMGNDGSVDRSMVVAVGVRVGLHLRLGLSNAGHMLCALAPAVCSRERRRCSFAGATDRARVQPSV